MTLVTSNRASYLHKAALATDCHASLCYESKRGAIKRLTDINQRALMSQLIHALSHEVTLSVYCAL